MRKIIQRIDIKLTPQLTGGGCAEYLQIVGMNNKVECEMKRTICVWRGRLKSDRGLVRGGA